ncbi:MULTISPECIES: DegT/DnrJ/EryC1/StrS family aminotransferase [Pseudoalteromonas]|uniref:UDP-4-amino-4-deoxy-L-arabinose-oxoglutarate aminotransferase n=1 Tax=Pseudoalteromonas rubra TaxID=43658 RepID=A0A0F4QEU4_9GAMM|nr:MULTISPECIES: DegT/DnrJ/EryC1/StrS aminotransferase family protein [Pseudoalteromonas]KJZ05825.1 UDP-4-amino-4-deoxy-L-arabinose-oxoglutarate aminotransferase [Pseudoalteromonas rubra]MDK1289566.1 DegT/DnrJ/EryC1/StrS aminotransferase family protein [Pseudoalteromonas sp. B95]
MNIRLFKPSFGDEELTAVQGCFDRSWVGLGNNVNEFEKQWKEKLGCEEAIALNSATAALHLALACMKLPKGSKVLVNALTFASSATAILYNDLVPVFVDSDPETLGMSFEDLQAKYTDDCSAIVVVHYSGHPSPVDKIVPWAKEKGIKVVEDCAHTTGPMYKGKRLGLWGDIGCYSFEEKKLMTTGDGGMLCSNDSELVKDMKALRWVGIDKDNWKTAQKYTDNSVDSMHWFYEISVLGFKYNMNDLAASIGLVQLAKLDQMNQNRSGTIRKYVDGLVSSKTVKPMLPYNPEDFVYQVFAVRTKYKHELILFLKEHGVATGCHYTPLTMQPLFEKYEGECPIAEAAYEELVTLPLHSDLTDEEVNYVIEKLLEFDAKYS